MFNNMIFITNRIVLVAPSIGSITDSHPALPRDVSWETLPCGEGYRGSQTADNLRPGSPTGEIPLPTATGISCDSCTGPIEDFCSGPTVRLSLPGTTQGSGGISLIEKFIHVAARSGGRSGAKRTPAPRGATTCRDLQGFGGSFSSRRNPVNQGPALDAGFSVYRYPISCARARLYTGQVLCVLQRLQSGGYRDTLTGSYLPDYQPFANHGNPRGSCGDDPGRNLTLRERARAHVSPPFPAASDRECQSQNYIDPPLK